VELEPGCSWKPAVAGNLLPGPAGSLFREVLRGPYHAFKLSSLLPPRGFLQQLPVARLLSYGYLKSQELYFAKSSSFIHPTKASTSPLPTFSFVRV